MYLASLAMLNETFSVIFKHLASLPSTLKTEKLLMTVNQDSTIIIIPKWPHFWQANTEKIESAKVTSSSYS